MAKGTASGRSGGVITAGGTALQGRPGGVSAANDQRVAQLRNDPSARFTNKLNGATVRTLEVNGRKSRVIDLATGAGTVRVGRPALVQAIRLSTQGQSIVISGKTPQGQSRNIVLQNVDVKQFRGIARGAMRALTNSKRTKNSGPFLIGRFGVRGQPR